MTQQAVQPSENGQSATDRLKSEVGHYMQARLTHLAEAAVAKVTPGSSPGPGQGSGGGGLAASAVKGVGRSVGNKVSDKVTGAVPDSIADAVPGLGGSTKDEDANEDTPHERNAAPGGTAGGLSAGGKAVNIVEAIDVGRPVRAVYDNWTRFEDFASFAKGIQSVSQSDDVTTDWEMKIGPSSRSWQATIVEQVPDERIVWTSSGAKGSTRGVVSFHDVTPDLTRVVVVCEYYPAGVLEKTANVWRAQGRRLRLDLKHFQRYVTLNADDDVEGWRGEVRDGAVVRTHEQGLQDDEADQAEQAGRADRAESGAVDAAQVPQGSAA